jgi:hypothetical protein
MNLEHLIVSQSKDILKIHTYIQKKKKDGLMTTEYRNQLVNSDNG